MDFLFPLLRALNDGRVLRGATGVSLGLCAVLVGLAGLVAFVGVLKASFSPGTSGEATLGGLLAAAIVLVGTVAAVQVLRFHVAELERLSLARFVVIPIASLIFRVIGELYAVGSLALGLSAFAMLTIAPSLAFSAGLGFPFMPGLPTSGGALAGVTAFGSTAILGFAVLMLFYLFAEAAVVVADSANQLNAISTFLREGPAVAPPSSRETPVARPELLACSRCGTPNEPPNQFCERCGWRLADGHLDGSGPSPYAP